MNANLPNYKRTKRACYTAYFTMSSVFSLPPLLFVTLHQRYGISYSLLGFLVLTNFCTQMGIDLIFTFFSRRFSAAKIVRVMPLITALGLLVYGLIPVIFPQYAFWGFFAGTVIFSVSAGLSEVLLSPTIAALPSDNPQRDMSMLHSLYAFGVLFVVLVSTVFFRIFGQAHYVYLVLFFAFLPVLAAVMFLRAPMPDMQEQPLTVNSDKNRKRTVGLILCVGIIFFGSCAENVMSNWISGYMERALHIPKATGDILGMAMFAVLLGTVRVWYGKFGKNIFPILLLGMLGSVGCYLIAGLASGVVLPLIGCMLTGLFTAMLWPGTLILMEEKIPHAGVTAFALMAAGGDLGASVAPQLMGIVVDKASAAAGAAGSAVAEQVGMRTGMLVSTVFPVCGVVLLLIAAGYFRKMSRQKNSLPE